MYFQQLSRDSDAGLSAGTMRLRATLLKPTGIDMSQDVSFCCLSLE